MDPITHALIGIAVSAAGQQQDTFNIFGPITISTMVGAVIPDGDIILQLRGSSTYLKHHRGGSHSLIGIVIEALLIGLIIKFIYPFVPFLILAGWTFIGALTHIISDIMNSYGAMILWPLTNKKFSLSLLTIADPVIIILSVVLIFSSYNKWPNSRYTIIAFIIYISSRIIMRIHAVEILKKKFKYEYSIRKIHLLPSMIASYKLHYIIEDPFYKIVGEVNFLSNKVRVFNTFKNIDHVVKKHILHSKTAGFFKEFTPIFHVRIDKINHGYKALLTDLRYMMKNEFLHHATIIYDEKMNIIEEKFNPYNINKKLDV